MGPLVPLACLRSRGFDWVRAGGLVGVVRGGLKGDGVGREEGG